MTYFDHHVTTKGQLRNLTSGQVINQVIVMIKIGHDAYVSMRLDETDSVIPFSRLKIYFLKVTLQKKLVISHDLFM